MMKKYILFLAFFALFLLVACNEVNESSIENPSLANDEKNDEAVPSIGDEIIESSSEAEIKEFTDELNIHEVKDGEYIERIHHLIAENETLEDIANIHHTTVEILKQINWFIDPDHLPTDTQLRIPPAGFPLHQDIEINITRVNIEDIDQIDADIIFDFDNAGSNFLVEIYSDVQDIKVFLQDLSTGPRKPYVSPVIGYIRPDSIPGQILLLNYDSSIPTLNGGIKFTDDAGMDRYFVIGWTPMLDLDPWIIYDFTVEFWN